MNASEFLGLKNKVIVITGSSGLLGSHVSEILLDLGATVIGIDLVEPKSDRIKAIHQDVGNIKDTKKFVQTVWDKYGSFDAWINCAFPKMNGFAFKVNDFEDSHWHENVHAHLDSYCLLSLRVCEMFKFKKVSGTVLNVASIFGIVGQNFGIYEELERKPAIPYAAIKSGMINFSRYCASIYGGGDIRINCIAPGGIKSERVDSSFDKAFSARVPLRRLAEPDEIAKCAVFLISDAAAYVNGEVFVVDGGYTAI